MPQYVGAGDASSRIPSIWIHSGLPTQQGWCRGKRSDTMPLPMTTGRARGCAMTQVVKRRPLDAEVRSNARCLYVGFLVDEVAMGQGFLRKLRVSSVLVTPPMPYISFTHLSPMLYNFSNRHHC